MSGCSVPEAAKKAGVSTRAGQRARKRWGAELADSAKVLVDAALRELRVALVDSAKALAEEVDTATGANRINAARAVFAAHQQLAEVALFAERLDALEEKLGLRVLHRMPLLVPGVEGTVPARLVQEDRVSGVGPWQRPLHRVLRRGDQRAVHRQRFPIHRDVFEQSRREAEVGRVEEWWRDEDDNGRRIAGVVEDLVVVADDASIEGVYLGGIAGAP